MKSGLTKKIIALVLALTVCLSLCACGGKLKGTYQDQLGLSTLTFDGNRFELVSAGLDEAQTGTYVIEDAHVLLSYDNGESKTLEYDEENDALSYYGLLIYSKVEN